MARYLFTVWSFPGHINPNYAVAVALREHGHEVAFYTGGRAARVLGELGMVHYPMRHIDEERLYRILFPPDDGAGRVDSIADVRRLRSTMRMWMLDTLGGQVADLEPVLEDWRPDVIVCDPAMWAPFLVLGPTRSIPVAIFTYLVGCMLSGPQMRLWGRGLPPPTTLGRRLRGDLERFIARRLNGDFVAAASALRVRYGLAPLVMSPTDFAGSMPLYLVTSVPELDYNRTDLPAHVRYVGRCTWDRPSHVPPPAWLDALPADKPIVYVTEGTVQGGQPRLLQAAARGLAGLPVHVVLSLNADRDAAEVGLASLPSNVWLKTYAPGQGWQGDILERASLVITNGGAGSVLASLAEGVPLIVAPTAWDKSENAQRVMEAGAGLRLAARRATPERLRHATKRVLGDPSYRDNARCLAQALGRINGPRHAADILEGMCAHTTAELLTANAHNALTVGEGRA